jgi:hypothetical protein
LILYSLNQRWHAKELGEALATSDDRRRTAECRLAETYLDEATKLFDQGEPGHGMLWLVRSLESAPPEATGLQRVARTNLADWYYHISQLTSYRRYPYCFLDNRGSDGFTKEGERLILSSLNSGLRAFLFHIIDPDTDDLIASLGNCEDCRLAPLHGSGNLANLQRGPVYDLGSPSCRPVSTSHT